MTAALSGQPTLVDTGPLVAWFDRADQDHLLCARYFASTTGPLISTWPVATEVCHLVPAAVAPRFLEWIQLGGMQLAELPTAALLSIAPWMRQYDDLPMDLADASLLPGGEVLINVLDPQA